MHESFFSVVFGNGSHFFLGAQSQEDLHTTMFNNHVFKVVSFKKESAEVMKVGKLNKSAVIRPLGSL